MKFNIKLIIRFVFNFIITIDNSSIIYFSFNLIYVKRNFTKKNFRICNTNL